MKNINSLPVFTFVAFMISCAGQMTPIPGMESNDAKLYSDKCSSCHSLPHPKRHTFKQWEHIVAAMEKEVKHKEMPPLTKNETSAILNYLKKYAR